LAVTIISWGSVGVAVRQRRVLKIGIVGYGVLGKRMHKLFPTALIFDKYGDRRDDLSSCDLAFIAVPTDLLGDALDESEIEDAVKNCEARVLVIRSATNPGFADRMAKLYKRRIVIQPEYFGESENHPFADGKQPPFMILGGTPEDRRETINAYATVFNSNISIRQVTALEAEVIKLSENRAIFFKLMQIQELYGACEAAGVDFYTIRDAVYGDDPRFDLWWTFVYPSNRAADSKCLPKDIHAWASWASKNGADASATEALINFNKALKSISQEK
jgi:UDPglucose 6-dehydrogenase